MRVVHPLPRSYTTASSDDVGTRPFAGSSALSPHRSSHIRPMGGSAPLDLVTFIDRRKRRQTRITNGLRVAAAPKFPEHRAARSVAAGAGVPAQTLAGRCSTRLSNGHEPKLSARGGEDLFRRAVEADRVGSVTIVASSKADPTVRGSSAIQGIVLPTAVRAPASGARDVPPAPPSTWRNDATSRGRSRQSARSARAGSMRVARRAGTYAARMTTIITRRAGADERDTDRSDRPGRGASRAVATSRARPRRRRSRQRPTRGAARPSTSRAQSLRAGAERHANPDLARAFADDRRHHAVQSDRREQQRRHAERAHQQRTHPRLRERRGEKVVHRLRVPQIELRLDRFHLAPQRREHRRRACSMCEWPCCSARNPLAATGCTPSASRRASSGGGRRP